MKPDSLKITVSKDGPYIVSGEIPMSEQIIIVDEGGVPVEWRTGKKFSPSKKCSLCRCGRTKNKPFCDGMHTKVNFDGTEAAGQRTYLEQAEVIDGPAVYLTDSKDLCASARFCHRAGEIWNLIPKSDDEEARRIAIEEARDCPSGRLVVWDKKTKEAIEPNLEPSIGLIEDPQMGCSGPIWARGGIPVESADGSTYEIRNRVTLCRCGKSSNKPFCDSSHYPEHREMEVMSNE